jgi:hypothetical protein
MPAFREDVIALGNGSYDKLGPPSCQEKFSTGKAGKMEAKDGQKFAAFHSILNIES